MHLNRHPLLHRASTSSLSLVLPFVAPERLPDIHLLGTLSRGRHVDAQRLESEIPTRYRKQVAADCKVCEFEGVATGQQRGGARAEACDCC